MSTFLMLLLYAGVAVAAWYLGQRRALALVDGDGRGLHSRPAYYGYLLSLCFLIPALAMHVLWTIAQGYYLDTVLFQMLPADLQDPARASEADIAIGTIRSLADSPTLGSAEEWQIAAVNTYLETVATAQWLRAAATLGLGLAGLFAVYRLLHPGLRARNLVETIVRMILIACASVAILTTVGIVLSMVFEKSNMLEKPLPNQSTPPPTATAIWSKSWTRSTENAMLAGAPPTTSLRMSLRCSSAPPNSAIWPPSSASSRRIATNISPN